MIIYEVNIEIDNSIYNKYIVWLNEHLEDMLKIDGFLTAKMFKNIEHKNSDTYTSIVVHYEVESNNKIEQYFNNQASAMRKQAKDLFGDSMNITRRILSLV